MINPIKFCPVCASENNTALDDESQYLCGSNHYEAFWSFVAEAEEWEFRQIFFQGELPFIVITYERDSFCGARVTIHNDEYRVDFTNTMNEVFDRSLETFNQKLNVPQILDILNRYNKLAILT